MEKLWDLKPDDGGQPRLVEVGNVSEAMQRDPARYSRELLVVPEPEPAPAPEPEPTPVEPVAPSSENP